MRKRIGLLAPPESSNSMNIVVSGGTGFIGRPVCAALRQDGHKIFLLTRRIEVQRSGDSTVTVVEWNGQEAGAWEHCLDGADVIINLESC